MDLIEDNEMVFQKWMKDTRFDQNRYIGLARVIDDLQSHLGYSYSEVKDIIKKVAKALTLKYIDYYGGGGYTW